MTISALSDVAIRTAVAEVLAGTIAGVRAITASTVSGDLVIGAEDQTAALRANVLPSFTLSTEYAPSPDRAMGPTVPWFDALTLTVELTSLLPSAAYGRLAYDASKAANQEIGSLLRGALAWPGKVTTTSATVETGIVSGVLVHQGTTVVRDTPPPNDGTTTGGGLYVTSHVFSGVVRIDRATT